MKTSKILCVCTLAALTFITTSCKKDDDNNKVESKPVAQAIAKTYDGSVTMSVSGQEQGTYNVSITIAADGENTAKITLPAAGSGMMALMECEVTGVNVTKDGDSYTLIKDNYSTTLTKDDGTTITYTGSINGTVGADKKLAMTYSIKPGAMPMSIDFVFSQE